jgi:hypothetical protein
MRVTINLDSGGFMVDECLGEPHIDVGYFETAGTRDIEVFEDGHLTLPPPEIKLGNRNERIDVQHLEANGTVKSGVNQLASFKNDILKKSEIYPTGKPVFIVTAYDCILKFHSGEFQSSNLKSAHFKECRLNDDQETGNSNRTRQIAHDVLVHFDLASGEEVRLRRANGTDLWSSSSIKPGTKAVEVKILADASTDSKYFRKAIGGVTGPHYHLPNPDPPPMNGH